MALDPYDYDERDRPQAFKNRKKTGKWCKGKKGVECVYKTISTFGCYWTVYSWLARDGTQRAYWKCGCKTRCENCGRLHYNRWRDRHCLYELRKRTTAPTDPNVRISQFGW